jgi:hypothetical protein
MLRSRALDRGALNRTLLPPLELSANKSENSTSVEISFLATTTTTKSFNSGSYSPVTPRTKAENYRNVEVSKIEGRGTIRRNPEEG